MYLFGNIYWSLLLCLGFVSGQAKIKFEETKHDFGTCEYRSNVAHTFVFYNRGDAPLVIESHSTSCHCTTALYDKAPVMPGEKGEIIVKYDATKVGKFFRKVGLNTNSGKVTLTIKGEISANNKNINPLTGEPRDK